MFDPIEPLGCSVKQTCALLGIGRSAVFKLLASGELEAVKYGRKTIITYPSIKKRFESLPRAEYGRRKTKRDDDGLDVPEFLRRKA
jgi:excisionase family DNA binding protein